MGGGGGGGSGGGGRMDSSYSAYGGSGRMQAPAPKSWAARRRIDGASPSQPQHGQQYGQQYGDANCRPMQQQQQYPGQRPPPLDMVNPGTGEGRPRSPRQSIFGGNAIELPEPPPLMSPTATSANAGGSSGLGGVPASFSTNWGGPGDGTVLQAQAQSPQQQQQMQYSAQGDDQQGPGSGTASGLQGLGSGSASLQRQEGVEGATTASAGMGLLEGEGGSAGLQDGQENGVTAAAQPFQQEAAGVLGGLGRFGPSLRLSNHWLAATPAAPSAPLGYATIDMGALARSGGGLFSPLKAAQRAGPIAYVSGGKRQVPEPGPSVSTANTPARPCRRYFRTALPPHWICLPPLMAHFYPSCR